MFEGLPTAINNIDIHLLYIINLNLQNSVLDVLMPIITYAGTQIFWIVICALLFVFGGEKGKNVAIICIIALLIGYFITEALKYIIIRPRPFYELHGLRFLTYESGYSFPSGHAIAAFTGCTIIGKKYDYFYPLIAFACLIAFTRIYLGVHYPSDVILGAAIGVITSLIVLRYEKEILKYKTKLMLKIKNKFGDNS